MHMCNSSTAGPAIRVKRQSSMRKLARAVHHGRRPQRLARPRPAVEREEWMAPINLDNALDNPP